VKDIFKALQVGLDNPADRAVIPIENSTNGVVIPVYDILALLGQELKELRIFEEFHLRIRHSVIGFAEDGHGNQTHTENGRGSLPNLTNIQRVYSHPQAFGQCTKFLNKYLSHAQKIDATSTSAAAELAGSDSTHQSVAIANRCTIENTDTRQNGSLRVLHEGIEDSKENVTRFVVFGLKSSLGSVIREENLYRRTSRPTSTRLLVSFSTSQNPKSQDNLVSGILCFQSRGIRIANLVSRPYLSRPWQHIFFVEGAISNEHCTDTEMMSTIQGLCDDLRLQVRECRFWGMWEAQHSNEKF
jgi:prephenate dehydratase